MFAGFDFDLQGYLVAAIGMLFVFFMTIQELGIARFARLMAAAAACGVVALALYPFVGH